MTEHEMNRQFAFSCMRELGPVTSYRGIQIRSSLIDEPMGAKGHDADFLVNNSGEWLQSVQMVDIHLDG